MKKLLAAALCFTLVVSCLSLFTACGGGGKKKTEYEIAVVTDVGQLMDGGFNQGTYEGAKAYAEANNKTYKYYQPANGADATDNDRIAAMRLAIQNGAKVIVAPGFLQAEAMTTVATESPDVKFLFVDGWALGLDNVTAIVYKEQESGYLAGYAAVKEGYRKLGGTFGGGGGNPACNRFAYGYVQGAKAAAEELDADVEIKISFNYGDTFGASPELQTQISGWYTAGTEVVFACGGSMVNSVIAAANETPNGKIIGVDVDQSSLSDRVITSAVKGLSASVQLVLKEFYEGKWDTELANKASNLGAAEDATGLPTATWRMTNFTLEQYNALFAQVKAGTVTIDAEVPGDAKVASFWEALSTAKVSVTLEA
ncbi:MAG: BMP family ABC transporter substrate-binding protein [Clostridia bacterium]|nr:BMP family ABC transporter substrate-binding protein [Clostridia bacterium]